MKLTKFLVSYKPQKKCGVDPISAGLIGSLGSGVLGLGGSILASGQSSSNVASQLSAQAAENQKNRDYQTAEAEKARRFTTSERVAQQAYQTGERIASGEQSQQYAKEMADINAMYNSPVYQSQELRKAGINPQVYFGQNSTFAGSSQSAGSAPFGSAPAGASSPSPSGVGGLSPVGFQPIDLQIPALQQGIASLVKAGTDKSIAPAQIKSLLADAQAKEKDAELKSLLGQYQKLANSLFEKQLPWKFKEAVMTVEALKWQIENAQSDNDRIKSQTALNHAEEALKKQMEKLSGFQALTAQFEYANIEEFWRNRQNVLKSQSAANNASAALSFAQARTENELREWKKSHSVIEQNKMLGEIDKIKTENQHEAIKALRDITGLSDSFWNDLYHVVLKGQTLDKDAVKKWLLEHGID